MSKIDIEIDSKVLFQMFEYASYASYHFDSEIAGWAHYNEENGIYKLAPLPKQIVSGAEVDTFPDAILNDVKYDISDMVVQWHSHVNMGVTPSSTDLNLIKEALKLFPMLISIIVNCKHEYSARLSVGRVGMGKARYDIPNTFWEVNLLPYYNNSAVSKEVLAKCKKPAPVVVHNTEKRYGGYYNDSYGFFRTAKYEGFRDGKAYYTDENGTYGYWDSLSRKFMPLLKNWKELKEEKKNGKSEKKPEKQRQEELWQEEEWLRQWGVPDKVKDGDENAFKEIKQQAEDYVEKELSDAFNLLVDKAELLVKADPHRFACYRDESRVSCMVTDNQTSNYVYFDPWSVELNDSISDDAWNGFLEKVGYAAEPYIIKKTTTGN